MRRWIAIAAAALSVAVVWNLLPPDPLPVLSADAIAEPPRGVLHVHTRRSDGSGTVDQIAAAAARAGLRFVIFTDHGDGTRRPERPVYLHGVLCLDAVEISTTGGHVVALGLTDRTPYRLGGDARDVIEDVTRLGGMSIAAHPGSMKSELRWQDWDAPFDGIEWLNLDSEWRDESPAALGRALLTYPFRKASTIATLFDRPAILERWDAATKGRRVVALIGADAHASLGFGTVWNPYGDRSPLAIPGYEPLFRAASMALPRLVLTGDAAIDADSLIEEIRRGRLYSTIDALGAPGRLALTAAQAGRTVGPGESIHGRGPVTFEIRTNAPPESRIVLLRDGTAVAEAAGGALRHDASGSGAYRVEVRLPDAPGDPAVPWLLSNPVYVGGPADPHTQLSVPAVRGGGEAMQYTGGPIGQDWVIERNPGSAGEIDIVETIDGTELLWRYALAGSERDGAYVALAMRAARSISDHDRLLFSARASRPMRIWVHLRTHTPQGTAGWRRSVYLDETPRRFDIAFSDLRPLNGQPRLSRPPSEGTALLFAIDETHTPLGTAGQVWIDDLAYGR